MNNATTVQAEILNEAMTQIKDFGFIDKDFTMKTKVEKSDKEEPTIRIDVTVRFSPEGLKMLMYNNTHISFLPAIPNSDEPRKLTFTTYRDSKFNSINFHLI